MDEQQIESVAILGLGPSVADFFEVSKRWGGTNDWTEVWGINAMGGVARCDRIFHMDDVRIQELRTENRPNTNIAKMLEWMRKHPGPIYTSRTHPDYPGLVDFPLEDVVNDLGSLYFNSTAAYAVAYAIHRKAKRIGVFGCDFTYPDAHHAERGRACVEYWLGHAAARGIKIVTPINSCLMDAIDDPTARPYGYDTLSVELVPLEDGGCKINFQPLDDEAIPTAEEIEKRYDHSQHPNKIVRDAAE